MTTINGVSWCFNVIYIYIYIYISYGMYDQHICKSYTYDGLGVSENVSSLFHILLSLHKFTYIDTVYTHTSVYIYIYIYIHMNTYIYIYVMS